MGDVFSDREKAFEGKWAHDEELRFKVLARRNRLLGLWAASEKGIHGEKAEEYAKAIVEAEVAVGTDEAIFQLIKADFATARIARTDHLIRRKMDEFLTAAKTDVMNGS